MTIILFLVDTSASMNQRTYLGTNFLDIAKVAVETFLKVRCKDPAVRGQDRYMLMTFEEPPENIKVGWREGQSVFADQLKRLTARGVSTLGDALGEALKLLNLNRMTSGSDNYGLGRYPYYLEQAAIVCITDGGCITTNAGVQHEVCVPRGTLLGSDLTVEPFRWDQRIYSLVLRYPGHKPLEDALPPNNVIPCDSHPIDAMCVATGGRSFSVGCHRWLVPAIETLVSNLQSGVTVWFQRCGELPPPVLIADENECDNDKTMTLTNGHTMIENGFIRGVTKNSEKKPNAMIKEEPIDLPPESWSRVMSMVLVSRTSRAGSGNWPLPEHFWPDPSSGQLPSRPAHPVILYKCDPREPLVCPDFPFDKYELAPSPLTQYILSRKQPNVCWQVFIANSSRYEGTGMPFGYLKASTNLQCVNLFVMPYNYEVLLPLLDDLRQQPKLRSSSQWLAQIDRYVKSVPTYYFSSLRKAFTRLNIERLIPDNEQAYSFAVLSNFTKMNHQAKEEMKRVCAVVSQQLLAQGYTQQGPSGVLVPPTVTVENKQPTLVPLFKRPLRESSSRTSLLSSDPRVLSSLMQQGSTLPLNEQIANLRNELNQDEFVNFKLYLNSGSSQASTSTQTSGALYRNPLNVHRQHLLSQLHKMRLNLRQQFTQSAIPVLEGGMPGVKLKLQHAEDLHQLPVGMMGNYQDYLRSLDLIGKAPLRSIEAAPVRMHAFGNPFKLDKRNMFVDEADIDRDLLAAGASGGTSSGGKATRKHHAAKQGDHGDHGGGMDSSGSKVGGIGLGGTQNRTRTTIPLPVRRKGPLAKSYKWKRRRLSIDAESNVDQLSLPAARLETLSSADSADNLSIASAPDTLTVDVAGEQAAAIKRSPSTASSDGEMSPVTSPQSERLQFFSPKSELLSPVQQEEIDRVTDEAMADARRRIAKSIRTIGRCLPKDVVAIVNAVSSSTADRDALTQFAVSQAQRFKRLPVITALKSNQVKQQQQLKQTTPSNSTSSTTDGRVNSP